MSQTSAALKPVNLNSPQTHPLLAALIEPGTSLTDILDRFGLSLRQFHTWVTSATTTRALELIGELDAIRSRFTLTRAIGAAYTALAQAVATATDPEKRRRAADSILREVRRLSSPRGNGSPAAAQLTGLGKAVADDTNARTTEPRRPIGATRPDRPAASLRTAAGTLSPAT